MYSYFRMKTNPLNSQELIRRSQAGDPEAFSDLFEGYKNLVYRTAYLMLGNLEEAEDALQEIFVQLYRSVATYQASKAAFTTWLYQVTVNHCLNRRRPYRPLILPLEAADTKVMAEYDSRMGSTWEEAESIRQVLLGLSDKLRAVIVLRYYADLSYAEIAQSLEIPLGTVKSRLDLALKTMRKTLQSDPASIWTDQEVIE